MRTVFEIKDISTYRSELMGWSILWIMMLHFTFNQICILGFVAQYGFAGVDIFMMVSGLGLFFSIDKDSDIIRYYRRRFFRIFPTYYILGIFASLFLFQDTVLSYLFRCSTIGFWINGPYWEWYVPSIVSLYIIAPFLKRMIDCGALILLVLICILMVFFSYFVVSNELVNEKDPHFFLLYRIPAFIFGIICAYWIKNEISPKYFYFLLLIGIPCFILLFPHHHVIYNFKYLSLLFLLPVFTICFITLSKYVTILNPVIAIIGKASLEIYLIQSIFFTAIITGKLKVPSSWHDFITFALIILSSLVGILVHKLITKSGILRLM